jgi:hypothetical protein
VSLSRRDLLAAGAFVAGGAGALASAHSVAAGAGAAAPSARTFDPDDPVQVHRAYRRMRFATHERPFFWWMRGTRYAVIDNRPQPLFEMHVGTFMRCRDGADGRYTVTSMEIVFNADLTTGQPVERWRNPYTDEWLDLRVTPVGPTKVEYSAEGERTPPQLPGSKIETRSRDGRPVVVGDDLWLTHDQLATVTPVSGPAREFRVADLATYRSRLADVLDPAVEHVDCDVSYLDVTDWPRWMNMGDRPGTRLGRAAGRKVRQYADMPAPWRAFVAAKFPQIAANPAAALDLPPFRFER